MDASELKTRIASRFPALLAGLTVLSLAPVGHARSAAAQGLPAIELDPPIQCWFHNEFPMVAAAVRPAFDIQGLKLYFRCATYPDYYFVELRPEGEGYRAVAPKAEESCPTVLYYVEALTRDFTSSRTEERAAEVTSDSECRRRDPAAAWWQGDEDPGIVVGTVREGAAAFPPGFRTEGIAGFIDAAGSVSGGGIGPGAAIVIGAGGAAAAAFAVRSGDEGSGTTTSSVPVPAPPASTTAPSTTTTTAALGPVEDRPLACFHTTPDPPVIPEGESIRLDGSCSIPDRSGEGTDSIVRYEWDLGDGRVREGRVVTPVYQRAGTYPVTLTVTDSGEDAARGASANGPLQDRFTVEVTVWPRLRACFTATPTSGVCEMQFDASCSTGNIVRYEWNLDVDGVISNYRTTGKVIVHQWPNCSPPDIRVALTVTGADGATDTLVSRVSVQSLTGPSLRISPVPTSFVSSLEISGSEGPAARGRVVSNGARTDPVDGSAPVRHRIEGRRGENTVEGILETAGGREGLWRFDFTGAESFVSGSIRVEAGRVVAVDGRSVVFRVGEGADGRVKLSYRLSP